MVALPLAYKENHRHRNDQQSDAPKPRPRENYANQQANRETNGERTFNGQEQLFNGHWEVSIADRLMTAMGRKRTLG